EQVRLAEPVPPRRLQPKLPLDLETICLKCLQKEPSRRYDGAAALAEDLRRFLAGEPIAARPISPAGRLWRWCRRKPAVAGLAAAVGSLLLAGILGTSIAAVRFRQGYQRERKLGEDARVAYRAERQARSLAEDQSRLATEAVKTYYTGVTED